ncbi:MAG: hypothetical protein WA040_06865 [Anaerolineae bacterium]
MTAHAVNSVVAIATICLFALTGCGSGSEPSRVTEPTTVSVLPEIKIDVVDDIRVEPITVKEEVVGQPNCGGTDGVENEVRRSRTIVRTVELGTGLEVSSEVGVDLVAVEASVGAAVASRLGYTYGTSEELSRAITVKAAPNTSMKHSIRQQEMWEVGEVKISIGNQQFTVPFRFRSDFSVELVNSENSGCPTTPEPSNTPTATATSTSTPSPTSIFTPTSRATNTPTSARDTATPTITPISAAEAQVTPVSTPIVQAVAGELPICPETIQYGQVIRCSISSPGEFNTYTFDADVGDKIRIVMVRAGDIIEPEFALYNANGDWAYCSANSTKIASAECGIDRAGTYSIQAFDHSDRDRGDYTLSLQRLNNPVGATTIDFGQTITATIDMPMEYDFYTFFADAGDKIVVTVARSNSILEPEFGLYNERGNWAYCSTRSTKIAQAECTMDTAGQYSIQVNDQSDRDEGSYIIRLQKLNNPAGSVPINFGQTVEGSIQSVAEEDFYTFFADVNDKIVIAMRRTEGRMEPSFGLYNERGDWAYCSSSSTTAAEARCTVDRAGTYTIRATDASENDLGKYTLTLQRQ